jgi:sphingolipid delta-4 desaturase
VATVFLVSFFLGQVVIHAAGGLLHETAHRLVFRSSAAKLGFDLGLELILASFGKQLTYQHEHLTSHHPYMGDYDRDYEHEDICAYRARQELIVHRPMLQRTLTVLTLVVHALPFGFLIGDVVFPKIYRAFTGIEVKDRQRRIGATKPPRWQVALFVAVSALVNLFLFLAFGFWGWLYHNWSLSLFLGKMGISNLGQSLSEHDGDDEVNPTRSTYGWINWVLFNTGYHNEHHTFPNVAWSRLPTLRRLAPEAFHHTAEKSYLGYWWEHVSSDFGPSRRNALQAGARPRGTDGPATVPSEGAAE